MLLKNSIRQNFRAPVRLIAVFSVVILVCAFLTVGLNLRQISKNNVELLTKSFDVVAVPTFYATVNSDGSLAESSLGSPGKKLLGYRQVPAYDFDLSAIRDAAGVKDVFVHKQFGAFVAQENPLVRGEAGTEWYHDVFVFTYHGEEPLTIHPSDDSYGAVNGHITLEWSALGMESFPTRQDGVFIWNTFQPFESQARQPIAEALGLDDLWEKTPGGEYTGGIVLYPGETYIATGWWLCTIVTTKGVESERLDRMVLEADLGHSRQEVYFYDGEWSASWNTYENSDAFQPRMPYFMRYTDDFWETEAGQWYQDAVEICQINRNTLTAVATSDLSRFGPFAAGRVYISQGRDLSKEDYEAGNRVCLVSEYLAELNGWQIGDKLDFSFFETVYDYDGRASSVESRYHPFVESTNSDGSSELVWANDFFDEGTFEIVGLYDGYVTKGALAGQRQFYLDEGVDRTMVFLPEKAVTGIPMQPLTEYNTTILLDDEQLMLFMSEMEASGMLEEQLGAYTVQFDIDDQGLAGLKQSLQQLDVVSKLTLYLACAAAVVVVVLLAVLTALQNRRQIATLRSLGVRKRQIPVAVLSGILLVCLVGACLGGYIGHDLSDSVADHIINTAQMDLADTTFSALLAKDQVSTEDYAITVQSLPEMAVLAAGMIMAAFLLLSYLLVSIEARKSPMLTLGAKE